VFGDVAFAQAPFAALGGATLLSSVSEAATAADSVSQESRAGALILESIAASEAFVSLNNIMTAARAELATATAAQNFAASNLLATQAETATGTDTQTAIGTMRASMSELATATDAPSAIANLLAAIAEISTASDAVNAGRSFFVTVTESAVGSHTQSTTARFSGSIQELASGLDAYGKLKIANVYPAGLQLTVSVGNVLVWGTIPTDQTPPDPNWQNIPT
jgi:hypothetical protein